MSNLWVSLLVVGSLFVTSSFAASGYSVISPKSIRPGQNYKLSVSIYGASNVNVAASLTSSKGTVFPNTEKTVAGINDGEAREIEITNVPSDLTVNDIKLQVVLSGGMSARNTTSLTIDRKSMSIFIQTDKAKYKPKDTLKFRVFATDANLKPVLKPLDITLKDTKNDVFQWLKVSGKASKNGVLTLEYIVPEFGELGDWTIDVKCEDNSGSKTFTVEKYVLPRFELKINGPSYLLLGTKSNAITISAKYTFGEGVQGVAEIKVAQMNSNGGMYWMKQLSVKEELFKRTLEDGNAVVNVDIGPSGIAIVKITAKVYEAGTNEELNATSEIKVYAAHCKLSKMDFSSTIFRPGLDYQGYLELKQPDGSTFADDTTVMLTYNPCANNTFGYGGYDCNSEKLSKVKSEIKVKGGGSGVIPIKFPTKSGYQAYRIMATPLCSNESMQYDLSKFTVRNPEIGLSLQLSSDFKDVKVGAVVSFQVSSKAPFTAFNFLVLSKGTIVYQKDYQMPSANYYMFDVMLSAAMAPSAKFFVSYFGREGKDSEVVADYLELALDGSMENAVSVKFNKPQAELGEEVSVNVNAAPASYVGVLCVDRSVILLATGNDITQDDALAEQRSYGAKKETNDNGDFIMPFFCRCGPIPSRSSSTSQMLTDLNLIIMTSSHVATTGLGFGGGPIFEEMRPVAVPGMAVDKNSGLPVSGGAEKSAARQEFPETWIWADEMAGASIPSEEAKRRTLLESCSAIASSMPPVAKNGHIRVKAVKKEPIRKNNPIGEPRNYFRSQFDDDQDYREEKSPRVLDPAFMTRTLFPESWLWLDKIASSNGVAIFAAKVPDTITTWECSAFSLDMKKGLGIAPDRAKLIAKKDFFVQLLLPYSIKNEETFLLTVLVHQYTGTTLRDVEITLLESQQFESSLDLKNPQFKEQSLVRRIEMKTTTQEVAFHIRAPRVGSINITIEARDRAGSVFDKVIKNLRVEPQGVLREVTIPMLVSLKSGDPAFKKVVDIKVPGDGIVPGSVNVEVATIGDIMGPSLQNMDDLLQMPYGCGEQNMINFAPAMYIYRYLEAMGELDAKLKDKALKIMETGYTRELTFQHTTASGAIDVGGFSAFGGADGRTQASTWLTGFVMKSFAQASRIITISQQGLNEAVDWTLGLQQGDGSFEKRGTVIHKDFEGGSGEGIGLDAYMLISMSEYPDGFQDKKTAVEARIKMTADHLEKYAKDLMKKVGSSTIVDKDLYDLAIVSYALALTGRSYSDDILTKLDAVAAQSDGEKYWKMKSATTCSPSYRCYAVKPNPSEVEIAAYALLAYLKRGKCSTDAGCSYIVKWMSGKRQGKGGYCSTKDTVLAIQAISEFAQAQKQISPNLSVDFNYGSQSANFKLSSSDSTILKEQLFSYQPGQYVNISVSGTGSGIAQVNYRYNEVEITKYLPVDDLAVTPKISCMKEPNKEQVCYIELCLSQKADLIKGMSLVKASCLSGFVPAEEVTCDDCSGMKLNKYEVEEDKFVAYLNDVSSKSQCLKMKCVQKNVVTKFQPAVISFADYYSTDVRKEVMYSAPEELKSQDVCAECGAACGCPKGPVVDDAGYTMTPIVLLITLMALLANLLN